MNFKNQFILAFGLGFCILSVFFILICCKDKGVIKGETKQVLSDGQIELIALAVGQTVYSKIDPDAPPEKKFLGSNIYIKNIQQKEIGIDWVRGEYFGKKTENNRIDEDVVNCIWAFIQECGGKELGNPLSEEFLGSNDFAAKKETELNFIPCILKPNEECRTILFPLGLNGIPSKVKIKVKLSDGTYSGPYLIDLLGPDQWKYIRTKQKKGKNEK